MKILIVEDEKKLQDTLKHFLEQEKFVVECASDYESALEKIYAYDYECILLDIMLPGGSGLDILKELKKMRKKERVLILSAKDSIEDKVLGLEMGADDYLAKPFHLSELNARIKSVIRRHQTDGNKDVRIENLSLDPEKRTVFINENELILNRKEFDLLYYFVTNPERLMYKTALAESVWGDNIDQSDSLDFIYSQVKNLRKKLKDAGAGVTIKAVYGLGYKLSVCDPEQITE
ncbi:DNA-binding response regulator [Paludibacter sp. 221]|uniref:response regulator transcription factor n=1 Tax=Paludibacter sp. 221 TaxID=2302939 RepID=UPI0013D63A1A|nr:response regulator transcription factor [Paludibacter sp. 221]NDV47359.1 DNA-binding response regulator [Paludibacter sp. 221]